jgi:hypothetical protein
LLSEILQARMVRDKRLLLIGLLISALALLSLPARARGLESFSISLSFDSAGEREGAIELGFSLGRFEVSSRTAFGPAGLSREALSFNLKDGQLDLGLAADFDLAGFTVGRITVRLGRGLAGSAEFNFAGLKSGWLVFNFSASGLKLQGELAFTPLPAGLTGLEAKARYRLWLLGLELASTTALGLQGFSRQEFEVGLPLGPLALTSTMAFDRYGFSEERLTLGVQAARLLVVNASLSGTLAFGPVGYSGATLEAELHDSLFWGFYLNGLLEFDRTGLGSALLITDYTSNGFSLYGSGAWGRGGLSSGELSLCGGIKQAELGSLLLFGPEGFDSGEFTIGLPLGTIHLSSATTLERGGRWREELRAQAIITMP